MTDVLVVDCRHSYRDAAKRYHKKLPIDSVISEISQRKLISEYSRFEVLTDKPRRIYVDIERIPKDKPMLIYELIDSLNAYMKFIRLIINDFNYALTFNSGSATHDGLSYHLILHEYAMEPKANEAFVISFINSIYGESYADYVDCSVYSTPQLFKLPYYIGMTKRHIDTNVDNHHRIIVGEPSQCVIQCTAGTTQLNFTYNVPTKCTVTNISEKHDKKTIKLHRMILDRIKRFNLDCLPCEIAQELKLKIETIVQNMDRITRLKQKLVNRINRGIDKELVDTLYNIVKSKLPS